MTDNHLWRKAEETVPNRYLLVNLLSKRIKQVASRGANMKKDERELEKIALQEIISGALRPRTPNE